MLARDPPSTDLLAPPFRVRRSAPRGPQRTKGREPPGRRRLAQGRRAAAPSRGRCLKRATVTCGSHGRASAPVQRRAARAAARGRSASSRACALRRPRRRSSPTLPVSRYAVRPQAHGTRLAPPAASASSRGDAQAHRGAAAIRGSQRDVQVLRPGRPATATAPGRLLGLPLDERGRPSLRGSWRPQKSLIRSSPATLAAERVRVCHDSVTSRRTRCSAATAARPRIVSRSPGKSSRACRLAHRPRPRATKTRPTGFSSRAASGPATPVTDDGDVGAERCPGTVGHRRSRLGRDRAVCREHLLRNAELRAP